MNKGNYPSQDLLKKFDLVNEYGEIVNACVKGDLGLLEKTLLINQDIFI